MQVIKILKDYKGFKEGEIVTVSNNEAHALIDGKFGKLFKENRMMNLGSPKKSKVWRVK